MPERVVISWSGGKDSALTLYELQGSGGYLIHSLLVSMTDAKRHCEATNRLSPQARGRCDVRRP